MICELSLADKILKNCHEVIAINAAINRIHKALHHLAELGGGRSMLRGNAIELIFHFKLFQNIFCQGRSK